MKKLLTSLSLLAITLLANAYDAEVDGIYYNLDPDRRVAEVTYQYLPIGEINWSSDARFGLDGSDMENVCAATFPQDIWERLKTGTFFVTVRGDYPQIRVTSGWWETVWTGGDIDPGNERLAANGDGTWTLSVNFAGDPLADVIDAHNLLITGGGFRLENIYLVEANSGDEVGDEEKLFLWKNEPYHLEAVNIPEKVTYNGVEYTVTGIGAKAFRNCGNLATLTIPNSVTDIGSNSFQGCSGLTSLTFTNSVTNIGSYAFSGCSSLTSLTIPKSVTAIGYSAFEGCIGLTSIKVESGNTVYDSRENCNAIIETGTNTLFAGCKSSIIPNSVTTIGNGAFYNCRSLTSITIPNSVTTIGNSAFWDCSGLASLAIPNSVTTIGNSAFAYCRSLTSLTIPNSVDFIAGSAFEGCSGLASVTIPNSVTNIGNVAFYGCSGLTEVTSLIEEPFTIDKYVWFGVNTGEIPLYVPAGCKSKYEATEGWNVFKNIVEMEAPSGIAIDEINFPDEIFRNWVLAKDYGADGILTDEEIATVNTIYVGSENISDLKGIEFFTALKYLYCYYNQLTTLDVSKNTALTELLCSNNQLTSLDVSKNAALMSLSCPNNQLTSLDLSKNTALTEFECFGNQLASLDVSKNTALTYFDCSDNLLTSLDVSKSTALKVLLCGDNKLTSLDVSKNTALTRLSCYINRLTSLDVSKNVALDNLNCSGNLLTSLDVSKNTALTYLYCEAEELNSLDVSKNTALTKLLCGSNKLTSLDVSKNTALTNLDCHYNQLTSLDVSENKALTQLSCFGNQLTSLKLSQNGSLHFLDCYHNQLRGAAMDALIAGLPGTGGMFYAIGPNDNNEQNVVTKAQVAAAKEKGWITYTNDEKEYEGSDPEMDPIGNGEAIDIGTEVDENTDLDGNVVGDIFYSISSGDGSFDPAQGCIIVSKPTDDNAIDGKDIFGEDFKDNYTGIVFKVNEGKGTIKVEAETQGNMVLKVKIGNSEPIEMELDGKLKVKFPYNVSEETLVYIYGGLSDAAGAKGTRASTDGNDLLKIYGFEIVSDPSGIDAIENGKQADAPVYNLNGQRVNTPSKGVYIKNGRKVIVK